MRGEGLRKRASKAAVRFHAVLSSFTTAIWCDAGCWRVAGPSSIVPNCLLFAFGIPSGAPPLAMKINGLDFMLI